MHLARLTTVIAIVVASFVGGAARAADKYALDPMHTFVVFKITDMGYAHVVGWFTAVAGKLTFDPADMTKSSLNVTIKTASIDTHFAQRNKDLMSPDFLNVAEFPEMTFKSTSIEKTGDKTGRVTGEHVRALLPGAVQQGVQIGSDLDAVLRGPGRFALGHRPGSRA